MSPIVVIGFLAAAGVILWTPVIVAIELKARPWRALSYAVVTVAVAVAAYWCTYCYNYFPNPNTNVHGYPVPAIIYQRDTPTGPWLDYVGPTVILALPMNFIIFVLAPSLAFLTEATWRRWRFSLRTLLIAITLVALVLVLALWLR